MVRADFYFKTVLPPAIYAWVLLGSRTKSFFKGLDKIHVRAAKICTFEKLVHSQLQGARSYELVLDK